MNNNKVYAIYSNCGKYKKVGITYEYAIALQNNHNSIYFLGLIK